MPAKIMRNDRGYLVTQSGVLIHRAAYAKAYGRPPDGWHVHHIDHNKVNNKPENLIALPPAVHVRAHDVYDERGLLMDRQMLESLIEKWTELRKNMDSATEAYQKAFPRESWSQCKPKNAAKKQRKKERRAKRRGKSIKKPFIAEVRLIKASEQAT